METTPEGLEFIDPPRASSWLNQAPEPIANWFRRRYGEPTEIQRAAWSRSPTGQHLLLSAPTGTGKTLAAFLPILTQLIHVGQAFQPDGERAKPDRQAGKPDLRDPGLSCLYVSPLKALSAD